MATHVLYLHGFASSPGSNKAQFLKKKLNERGVEVTIPDLNVPDFNTMTLTAMIERIAETICSLSEGDVYLIGSSLGARATIHFYDRYHTQPEGKRVKKILLLAPAFEFSEEHFQELSSGATTADWKEQGSLPFYHYNYDEERLLHYGFVEDMLQYKAETVTLDVPVVIIHGMQDESVSYQQSVRFSLGRSNVDLRLVDSDHQLSDQADMLLQTVIEFFEV